MIWQICEYTATIIEYVIYADFMVRFLDVKKDKNKIISFFLIFLSDTLLTSVFNYFMNFEGILCVIRIALNISIAFFLLKGTLFEKAFSAIILDITALFVSFISLTLLGMLSGNSLE
jgi:hypothetical protein